MPIVPTKFIWMDGELVEWEKATIHVLNHSLHYGSGVFEGIRAYRTKRGPAVFRLTDHIERLHQSAKIYLVEMPFGVQQLIEASKLTVRENNLEACYIRPLVYHGYGEMGLNPLVSPVKVAIMAWTWGAYLGEEGFTKGVKVKISSWRRNDQNAMPPAAKATGQYLNSGLAKVEAVKSGYDEAIMLNMFGHVADATGENVFIVRDGVLLTPPVSAGPLAGITRDSIMTIARDLGIQVEEANLVRTDLYTADEAFLTGTAAEVVPIRSVDDRDLGELGPVTKKIQEVFFATVQGEVEKYSDWNEYV
ncbi:MAG TPA: branched-chain amino acid transaminase [Actinomycetota bacterium]|jgi:branched-chain amino acid aminotransferase|nr:branched-chain amino acid transaminase [Actinomycetota bacterium]